MRLPPPTARLISDAVNYNMRMRLPCEVEGRDNEVRPHYISVEVRNQRTESVVLWDGKNSRSECGVELADGIRVVTFVGNGRFGSGMDCSYLENIGEDSEVVAKAVQHLLEKSIRNAAAAYLHGIGELFKRNKQSSLEPIGRRIKAEYWQEDRGPRRPIEELEMLINAGLARVREAGSDLIIRNNLIRTDEEILFVDSAGSIIWQSFERIGLSYHLQGPGDGEQHQREERLFFSDGTHVTPKVLNARLRRLLQGYKAQQSSITLPPGEYPALLDGTSVGTLTHESIAHLRAGNLLGQAYLEPLGELSYPEWLTVYDNPAQVGGLASYAYDEEGVKAQRVALIEKGVISGYLLDVRSAAQLSQFLGSEIISNGRARSEWVAKTKWNPDEQKEERVALLTEPRITNLEIIVDEKRLLSKDAMWDAFLQRIKASDQGIGVYVECDDGQVEYVSKWVKLMPKNLWVVTSDGKMMLAKDGFLFGRASNFYRQAVAVGNPKRSSFEFCETSSGEVLTQDRSPALILDRVTVENSANNGNPLKELVQEPHYV